MHEGKKKRFLFMSSCSIRFSNNFILCFTVTNPDIYFNVYIFNVCLHINRM